MNGSAPPSRLGRAVPDRSGPVDVKWTRSVADTQRVGNDADQMTDAAAAVAEPAHHGPRPVSASSAIASSPVATAPVATAPTVDADRSPLPPGDDGAERLLADIIDRHAIDPVFQPIRLARDRSIAGFELLARGPEGSPLESPYHLFATANRCGRLADLDLVCQTRAIEAALAADLHPDLAFFINVEPATLTADRTDRLTDALGRARDRLRLYVEVPERDIFDHPASLVRLAQEVRSSGWGLAVDDLGVDAASLSLLPFLDPDVVKFDRSIVSDEPTPDTGLLLTAALDHSERHGTLLLAEGIETEREHERAEALRVDLIQGFRYGRPGAHPATVPAPGVDLSPPGRAAETGHSPFTLVDGIQRTSVGRKDLLLAISHDFERQARRLDDAPVLLSVFQDARHFGPPTAARYREIAANASFVGTLGIDMPTEPACGVRGGALHPDDPLAAEWTVVVISPHFAGALIAYDLGDRCEEMDRRFAFAVTHDRAIVTAAARILATRLD